MKERWTPSANPNTDRTKQKLRVKRGGLRAIDTRTKYDLTGTMRTIMREIERGERGDVQNVCLVIDSKKVGGGNSIDAYHWGAGGVERAHWMLASAMRRCES